MCIFSTRRWGSNGPKCRSPLRRACERQKQFPVHRTSVFKGLVNVTEKNLQHVLRVERAMLRIERCGIDDILLTRISNISMSRSPRYKRIRTLVWNCFARWSSRLCSAAAASSSVPICTNWMPNILSAILCLSRRWAAAMMTAGRSSLSANRRNLVSAMTKANQALLACDTISDDNYFDGVVSTKFALQPREVDINQFFQFCSGRRIFTCTLCHIIVVYIIRHETDRLGVLD